MILKCLRFPPLTFLVWNGTRDWNKMQNLVHLPQSFAHNIVPFGVTYEKIGTIQRRLAWPLHKDDTLSRSGRSTDLNIYFILNIYSDNYPSFEQIKPLNCYYRGGVSQAVQPEWDGTGIYLTGIDCDSDTGSETVKRRTVM
jgi:hypothetical protein